MPRKPRIWFPGAKYHITSRGNRKTSIFYDDKDYLKYLTLLEKTREKYPFYLHTYCLMTNHVHLQLETIDVKPGKIMNYLHSLYASYFNTKYELTGHLFQGRYGAELIDSFDYELDVSKYIHLNPFEAEMVEKPEDYRWSSCRAYVFQEKNPHIRTDRILSFFPEPQFVHYKRYITPRKLLKEKRDHDGF